MKISLKWLDQYVDVKEFFNKPQELSDKLTHAGLEVENMQNLSKQYDNVVVAHILERNQHPDADRLTVCQVSTGEGVVHQIVCGAKNHKAGDRVVASLPGAVLPGDFEIKKSKIRGVESMGMLCSEVELGIAKESDGIMILPADAPIGMPFAEYYGLNDVVFEIKVTPNRADVLSHVGLAREIASLLGRDIKSPSPEFKTSNSTKSKIQLEVLDTDACPRYAGRFIQGVKVGPSPKWLKQALEVIGLNSINNVVDVTNYVMMELGQPLHAFDANLIKGSKIRVAKSQPGEVFTTLDGTEIKLDGSELTIRDADGAVALAGVVGGKNSGVLDSTKDLFIEAAHFNSRQVRQTSRKHGIQTDSAYRFSRGTDVNTVLRAMDRCCELILKVAGGEAFGDHHDFYPVPLHKKPIDIKISQVSQRLGLVADAKTFEDWMTRLGCQLQLVSGTGQDSLYKVTPPSYRMDIEIKEDLIEEYARLVGYDKVPEVMQASAIEPTPHAGVYELGLHINQLMRAEGFSQAINMSFVSSKFENSILGDRLKSKNTGLEYPQQNVKVKNPLNDDLDVMRVSLVSGLIKNAIHNERSGSRVGRIFESGYVFDKTAEGQYVEDWRLAVCAWGREIVPWNFSSKVPLVLEIKTQIENVLRGLNSKSWTWNQLNDGPQFLHPAQSATLFFEGKLIGFLGTLHPAIAEEHKLREDVVIGEFDLSKLLQGQPRIVKTKSLPKIPPVERDLAFVMPKKVAAGDIMVAMKKIGGQMISSITVFDVFEGGALAQDEKSVAFRYWVQDPQTTLTDEQLLALQNKLISELSAKFGVKIR